MQIPTAVDLTREYVADNRVLDDFRPIPATAYVPGTVLQYVAQDSQVFPDFRTVQPVPVGTRLKKLAGVVSLWTSTGQTWGGFDGLGNQTSAGSTARASQILPGTIWGYHAAVQIDNTAGNTIADGVALASSATTAGKAQGDTSPVVLSVLGYAVLPAAGVGSSLTGAALAAAAQTITIAGTPATGDIYTVTLQSPYVQAAPGIAQTRTVTIGPLTAGQAASVTTAAAAVVAAIIADPVAGKYYTATNTAGVVTINPIATVQFPIFFASQWPVSAGVSYNVTPFNITLAGSAANGLTIAGAVVSGGGTVTAGGATFAAGAGFVGTCPAFIRLL